MSSTPTPMAPQFDPKPVEARWGAFWIEGGVGRASASPTEAKPFVLTIPPPNVTGVLHLGHGMQHTIHDCLLRFHRMKGDAALCVPGTDHAGIATQIKVEQLLRSEGTSREELGREDFLKRVWEWKERYGATINGQLKALGCSYDWERERFTMDAGYVKAVLTVFKSWFDRGLIYRGYRLVNWSSGAGTTVSDLEIEAREVAGSLTYIRYPVEGAVGDAPEFITVATTRPETMLGDTAVAVHPDDARYAHLRGKNVVLPLMNRAIPIVFDESVSMEFGTGAVKITPAHDPSDYEMGTRHGLEMISVIGFDNLITDAGGAYAGMDKTDARRKIVADLKALGLIEKVEPITHTVPHCARTGVVIEPLLSEQWFVAMKELARPVADAIRMNRVRYHAPRFAQTSLEWLDGIRDWCISRQLWWGHRIPIWYGPNGEVECSIEPIERDGWHQDADVLDTWFSSALWPFAVLGWPDDFERDWYPTSVLITGRDILNLWVSRMITTSLEFIHAEVPLQGAEVPASGVEVPLLEAELPPVGAEAPLEGAEAPFPGAELSLRGAELPFPGAELSLPSAKSPRVGQVPFHDVLVHPTIQDSFGQRMSKSLGTGIDPLELIDIYGADATRYGLLQLAGGAQDTRFLDGAMTKMGEMAVKRWVREHRGEALPLEWTDADGKPTERFPQMQAARNFANKIWNASRLVLSVEVDPWNGELPQDLPSRWIAKQLNETIVKVTESLEAYAFDAACRTLYEFIWGDFCDWFLETSKPKLREGDAQHIAFMAHVLEVSLRLLHPFMPFLSEEIWSRVTGREGVCFAAWPQVHDYQSPGFEADFFLIQDVVRAARSLRTQAQIPPSKKVPMTIQTVRTDGGMGNLLTNGYLVAQLANLEPLAIEGFDTPRPANAIAEENELFAVILPLEGLIDVAKERAKLERQLEAAQKDLAKVAGKLANPDFAANAPAEVVAKDTARVAELSGQIETLTARLAAL